MKKCYDDDDDALLKKRKARKRQVTHSDSKCVRKTTCVNKKVKLGNKKINKKLRVPTIVHKHFSIQKNIIQNPYFFKMFYHNFLQDALST